MLHMKNRLLFFLILSLAGARLSAQGGQMTITAYGTATCACDGCIYIEVNNGTPPYIVAWPNGLTNNYTTSPIVQCGFCPGTYSVKVSQINAQQTATATVVIEQLPYTPLDIVSLNPAPCNHDSTGDPNGSDCERVCAGATVTYTLNSVSNPGSSQVNWSVTGASSWTVEQPTAKTITVTWGSPGNGSIGVFSDNSQDCVGSDHICVTILDPPKAVIGTSPTGAPLQVCKGQTVQFQNLSTGDVDNIEWLFSDNLSNTTEDSPQHTFLNPGTFTISLIARSGCLCNDTTSVTVEVLDAVAPTLDCVATICPGETVTYTTSNTCSPYTWNVSPNGAILEGGTANSDSITVHWNDGPLGTINLSGPACSGATCPIAGVIQVPIVSDNAEIQGKESVCPGTTESYSIEPFGGAGFVWTLSGGGSITDGQGTNRVTITWWNSVSTSTTYWLSVTYNNCYLGCGGQDSIPVKIVPSFYVNGPVEACENSSKTFNALFANNNSPISCNWTLYAPNGDSVWATAASASVSPLFNQGDGYYRLFAEPAVVGSTCTDQTDWSVKVAALPAPLTGIDGAAAICPGTPYTYKALGGTATSNYQWTVKNGPAAPQTFAGATLNVTWAASGPYWLSVAQLSNDALGCLSDTVMLPASALTAPPITGNSIVCQNETGVYTAPAAGNADLQWEINPATAGSVSSGQGTNTAQIFWAAAGMHTVNLNICGLTATFPVTVNPVIDPVVTAPSGLCAGSTTTVQTAVAYASYAWKDASGTVVSTVPDPVLGPGSYAVEVVDANGCTGSKTFIINTLNTPSVSVTTADPAGFCNNSVTVSMTALTTADGNYTFQWFQNGTPIPGATGVSYATNQYGNYTVQATNAAGCTSTAGPLVLFSDCSGGGGFGGGFGSGNPPCAPGTIQAVADPTGRCDSFTVSLNDLSGLYVPGSAHWVAGVSGGGVIGTSTQDSASFIFPNAGKYIVLVDVMLSNGQMCEALDSLNVEAVAKFETMPACPGALTGFHDVSEFLPASSISSYSWQFDDPASGVNNTSSIRNASHQFDSSGMYNVTLTVMANSGCTATASNVAAIPDEPNVNFSNPAGNCAGNALEFSVPAAGPDIVSVEWNFGDPTSGASNQAATSPAFHQYATPGTYTVTATATNVNGCSASFSDSINIVANTLAGSITPPAPVICEGATVTLAAPGGGVSYLWSDSAATTTQFLTVGAEGAYRVTMTDASGCTYAPPAMNVEENPAPNALIKGLYLNDLGQVVNVSYPNMAVCDGEDVVLQSATLESNLVYSWSGGNGTNNTIYFTDDRNTLLSVGSYVYTVTVTNISTGCTAVTDPFNVAVNPKPSGFSINASGLCAGDSNTLTYQGPQPPNWQLIWNNGTSGPSLTTDQPGSYFIRVINEFGCESRSNPITMLPGPPVAALPSGCHTRCNPDTLCLPALPSVVSWQWYLDGTPIPGATSPDFVAQQSGTYWAELTDIMGCTGQSSPLVLNLYDGFGNILGQVWSDVNNNGLIDAADTLVSGIGVGLYEGGALTDSTVSNNSNGFSFPNILSTDYVVGLDSAFLPASWHSVIGQAPVSMSGCDVEAHAGLLIHFQCQSAASSLLLSACAGSTVSYNGTDIPAGDTLNFNFPGPGGCDSVVTVIVQTLSASAGTQTLFACPGDSAMYQGVNIPAGSSQNFTLQNVSGCDSVVTVTVQAWPTTPVTATALFACTGGSILYNGVSVPAGTTQQFTLQNIHGCDSLVDVTVIALPPSTGTQTLYACPGGSAMYQGTAISVDSSRAFTLQNWLGCDSIVTVSVLAWPTSTGVQTLYACPGGSAMYQGTAIPADSSRAFTLQNWLGCDSIVTVNVQAWPTSSSALNVGVCPGEVFVYQGVTLPGDTTQAFTLQNWLGCDSVVTVHVAQLHSSANTLQVDVCPGETYSYNGTEIPGGETRDFHLVNGEGCDSTVTVVVHEYPATFFSVETQRACANTPTGSLTARIDSGGTAPFRFSLEQNGSYQDSSVFNNLNAGNYTVYAEDGHGCVYTQEAVLNAIPQLEVQLNDGILSCDSGKVTLRPVIQGGDTASLSLQWWNGDTTLATLATEAGPVWVSVSDQCATVRSEAKVQWATLSPDLDIVYVPNVMKPASLDPENSRFRPIFAAGIELLGFHFEVFDRWGDKLFETESTSDAWDGIYRVKDMKPGVQVWYLTADVSICGRVIHIERKGDVTVLR